VEEINSQKKNEWKSLHRRPRYRWKSNIKMNIKEIGCDDVCWCRTERGSRLLWTQMKILFL
jgi:hypothetical protein